MALQDIDDDLVLDPLREMEKADRVTAQGGALFEHGDDRVVEGENIEYVDHLHLALLDALTDTTAVDEGHLGTADGEHRIGDVVGEVALQGADGGALAIEKDGGLTDLHLKGLIQFVPEDRDLLEGGRIFGDAILHEDQEGADPADLLE